jgi:hypothetical protein
VQLSTDIQRREKKGAHLAAVHALLAGQRPSSLSDGFRTRRPWIYCVLTCPSRRLLAPSLTVTCAPASCHSAVWRRAHSSSDPGHSTLVHSPVAHKLTRQPLARPVLPTQVFALIRCGIILGRGVHERAERICSPTRRRRWWHKVHHSILPSERFPHSTAFGARATGPSTEFFGAWVTAAWCPRRCVHSHERISTLELRALTGAARRASEPWGVISLPGCGLADDVT